MSDSMAGFFKARNKSVFTYTLKELCKQNGECIEYTNSSTICFLNNRNAKYNLKLKGGFAVRFTNTFGECCVTCLVQLQ